jgi:hypothetical protein
MVVADCADNAATPSAKKPAAAKSLIRMCNLLISVLGGSIVWKVFYA